MKNSFKAMMLSAAVTGLLSGSATPIHASSLHNGAQLGQAALASSSMMAQDTDKHSCKGKNDCKGKGGCKTSDNGCKGKNSCKGKGGCATDGSKK
ncbi:hypothetical protein [Edaphobacter albus]|uniref:hypothetical protein n=1 Tax=Edaphobacter sp. 4G125 TaxID=2763071 RepID=UPI00164401DD|nr:hypothetical protein [Edaphobacter sp. 4G125]QNI36107.1 hypothetical protein H7846_14040 [Edaphobacter sp. 4G125]